MTIENKTNSPIDFSAGCCSDFYQTEFIQNLLSDSFHPGGQPLTLQLAQSLLLHPKAKVLDLACGCGQTAELLASRIGCQVVACDGGIDLLNQTSARALDSSPPLSITTVCCDASQIPFADETFDAVICECALCTFSNKSKTMSEIYRVLKPRGRIGLSDVYWRSQDDLNQLKDSYSSCSLHSFSRMICVEGALTLENYQQLFQQAGFDRIKTDKVDNTLIEMVELIRQQIELSQSFKQASMPLEIPTFAPEQKNYFLKLERMIQSGLIGYALMTGRK